VLEIASQLEAAGVRLWVDSHKIEGGTNYGLEIVQAIKECKVLLLMCSNASLRSRNVKQEIQLAWKYQRPYLPLLLEPVNFDEQIEYWLEGSQWIELLDSAPERWLQAVLRALERAGVHHHGIELTDSAAAQPVQPIRLAQGLEGLRSVARFTDQIWPLAAEYCAPNPVTRSANRGLGAPQDDVQHGYRLGSRVCLAIESDRDGYLLLLDKGPESILYCLCPSWFAPESRLRAGRNILPQPGARFGSFQVSGAPGREELLAIITDEPLDLDWMPADSRTPARVLSEQDVGALVSRLQALEGNRWTVLGTYFDITA
jgi:hypothetical protein